MWGTSSRGNETSHRQFFLSSFIYPGVSYSGPKSRGGSLAVGTYLQMVKKSSLSGKTQGTWEVSQTTGKAQGIVLVQVVNSLILKIQDIAIFASESVLNVKLLQISEFGTGKTSSWTGKKQEIWNSQIGF